MCVLSKEPYRWSGGGALGTVVVQNFGLPRLFLLIFFGHVLCLSHDHWGFVSFRPEGLL